MLTSRLPPDSLAYALLGAAQALALVQEGTALPQALAQVWERTAPTLQARGAMQDIAYRSLRQWGRAEALLTLLAARTPEPALLYSLAACSLALLCAGAETPADAPYAPFTIVDQAVSAAAAHPRTAQAKGMINAVLRRFVREQDALLNTVLQQPSARWNYPAWWIDKVTGNYAADWQAILHAGNVAPPLSLRVNCRKTTVDAYLARLTAQGIAARRIGPYALRLDKPVPVQHIPGFADGWVSVQDAAAQLAAPLLDAHNGMRVLDACAAPGGKTGHVLELADLDLLAIDSDARRLQRIDENLQRLGLPARLAVGDASNRDWWDGQPFDRILADVPCTASGIVRRHPDIRWLRRPGDAARLATLSAQILDNLWQMLNPGGKLLFVTCSLWPEESERQAAAFSRRHRVLRLPAPGQLLPTVSADYDHDALFYALFQKPGND